MIGFLPQNSFADLIELTQQGDNALKTGNMKTAETAFAKALELDPENYRLLKSLGEIKFEKRIACCLNVCIDFLWQELRKQSIEIPPILRLPYPLGLRVI